MFDDFIYKQIIHMPQRSLTFENLSYWVSHHRTFQT